MLRRQNGYLLAIDRVGIPTVENIAGIGGGTVGGCFIIDVIAMDTGLDRTAIAIKSNIAIIGGRCAAVDAI